MSELWEAVEEILRERCRDLLLWGDVINAKTKNGVEVHAAEFRHNVVVRIGDYKQSYPKCLRVHGAMCDISYRLQLVENA